MGSKKEQITYAIVLMLMILSFSSMTAFSTGDSEESRTEDNTGLETGVRNTQVKSGNADIGRIWQEDFATLDSLESWSNIKLTETDIALGDDEILLFADNFSDSDIDQNRWFVQDGGGTVLTSADTLIVFKEGWQQTGESSIESHRSWNVERRVEFEWNSISEGGLLGYEHEIDVFHGVGGSERIWVTIRGDRQAKLYSNGSGETTEPPFGLAENQWYKFTCKLTTTTASLKIEERDGKAVNYQNLTHNFKDTGSIRFLFAETSSLNADFDIRLDNISLYAGYKQAGELVTKPVNLPEGFDWDRLAISNSEDPPATGVCLDVLEGSVDKAIPGFAGLVGTGHDLSGLNKDDHTGIRLRLNLMGNGISTPLIQKLTLSWQEQNSMQDGFIDNSKLISSIGTEIVDNKLELETNLEKGSAISKPIELPELSYWDSVLLDKFEPAQNSYLSFTLLDHSNSMPIENFTNLFDAEISLKELNPGVYPKIMMKIDFFGYSSSKPVLYGWTINWTANSPPVIIGFNGSASMYRGDKEIFTIFIMDVNEPGEELSVFVQYRSGASLWETDYLDEQIFRNGLWSIVFSPPRTAPAGLYSFRITVTDFFGLNTTLELSNIISVMNKPLPAPDVILSPSKPRGLHDLKCFVTLPPGISVDDVTIKYRWYRNGVLQQGFTTDTVRNDFTIKYDQWRCDVTLHDGYEEGGVGTDEVFILNSPPKPLAGEISVQLSEDGVNESGLVLDNIFIDPDSDRLNFTVLQIDHIEFNIDTRTRRIFFTPEPDWFGIETAYIYASDDGADSFRTVKLEVLPLNDAPELKAIGNQVLDRIAGSTPLFNALEGEKLRLQVHATDIDGDRLTYSTDRTDGNEGDDLIYVTIDENTGLLELDPPTGTLGEISINITVSDNNGSKTSQVVSINIQSRSKSEFSQFLLSTNWLVVIIGLIAITIVYFGFAVLRSKYVAYRRRKYREKLSGMGRLYEHYPIAEIPSDSVEDGRYPKDGHELVPLKDPYRAARYEMTMGDSTRSLDITNSGYGINKNGGENQPP